MNTYCFGYMETNDFHKIRHYLEKLPNGIGINDWSSLIIPLHINKNHWAFCEAFRCGKVLYYDSLPLLKRREENFERCWNCISNYLISLNYCLNLDYEVNHAFPSQQNNYDCGVFMLRGIEACASNDTPSSEYFISQYASSLRTILNDN